MSRLYDRVMSDCKPLDITVPWHLMEEATIINADNVAHYFLEHSQSERWKLIEGIPGLAPPLETVFIEAIAPSGMPVLAFGDETYDRVQLLYSWGVLCHNFSWEDDERANRVFLDSLQIKEAPSIWEQRGNIGWITQMWTFAEPTRKKPVGPLFNTVFALDRYGNTLPTWEEGDDSEYTPTTKLKSEEEIKRMAQDQKKEYAQLLKKHKRKLEEINYAKELGMISIGALLSLLTAISFMHCKNVVMSPVDPPAKLSLKHQRKHNRPLSRYHVLQIEPMKTILSAEGNIEAVGIKKALHICRGHFATYSPEKPLFGKYSGTFWKPYHVRGSKKEGQVLKDYKVTKPV